MATAIRTGEYASQAPLTQLKDKNTKTYYHMFPGAQTVLPDGLIVKFMGGQFMTNDLAIIAELDQVANKPASMIYTKTEVANAIVAGTKAAAMDAIQDTGTNAA